MRSRILSRQRRVVEVACARQAGAWPCVYNTFPHAHCPRCPTTNKFGEIENFRSRKFRSEIWVRIYPSVCLDVCRLCTIYLKITIFDFRTIRKRTRRTRGGKGGLPRLSLLTLQPPHDQKPPKPLKIIKTSKNAPKCDLELSHASKNLF